MKTLLPAFVARHPLVYSNHGGVACATYVYSDSSTGTFSETSPSKTNAGTYTVYYKLKILEARCWTGDETTVHSMQCSISPATLREWAF